MRIALALLLLCGVARAQDVLSARRIVVHQNVYVSAQAHAEQLAATGGLGHCSRRGGGYEGIGLSPISPDDACRRACYWGRRPVHEIGTAYSQTRRAWIAVVRYE